MIQPHLSLTLKWTLLESLSASSWWTPMQKHSIKQPCGKIHCTKSSLLAAPPHPPIQPQPPPHPTKPTPSPPPFLFLPGSASTWPETWSKTAPAEADSEAGGFPSAPTAGPPPASSPHWTHTAQPPQCWHRRLLATTSSQFTWCDRLWCW